MEKMLDQMLENYLAASNTQIEKGPNSIKLTMDSSEGISKTSIYTVLPYLHLIYFDIHARSLPGELAENAILHPMQFNYCIGGRIEMLLDDHSYIYLKENDFCISRQTSQSESYFPTKYYHGITLYFDPDFFGKANQDIAEIFALEISRLQDVYFEKKETYIAKKAERILTADLKQHIPIKQIAIQFGVSETSLKNYFRGVYGKNVSDYLRDLRMSTAEKLLTETKLPISEIASQIGYTKQGKFAEVFRQRFHKNPLEYRRAKKLEQI